jgi:hypothetical protein
MTRSKSLEIESPKAILSLPEFPSASYSALDLNRLTVFTIALLREKNFATSIENIAVANFRMFPKRFAMIGFPNFPDVSRVNRALLQLRPKYRNWATGNARLGWTLTGPGEAEATAVRSRLSGAQDGSPNTPLPPERKSEDIARRTVDSTRDVQRIRASSLFAKSQAGWVGVSSLEVFDVLDAYTHTPATVLKKRLRELRQAAVDADDRDVIDFLDDTADRFSLLFAKR